MPKFNKGDTLRVAALLENEEFEGKTGEVIDMVQYDGIWEYVITVEPGKYLWFTEPELELV